MAPYSNSKILKRTGSPSFSKRSPVLYKSGRVSARPRSRYILPPILEHSPNREARRRSAYFDPFGSAFDAGEDSDQDPDCDPEQQAERPTFLWEDEKTLVSDLLHNGDDQESEDTVKLASLAESLQTPFSHQSKELLDEIADTLVPAVNTVKRGHQILNEKVDETFALGILEFDEACKTLETATISSHNEIKKSYHASQARVRDLLKQLEEAYARRNRLCADFEKALDEIADPAIEALKALPSRAERVIETLEKNNKRIEKDAASGRGKDDKYLKELLSKLAAV
ncbi:hypothetical protein D9757_003590 [Collybiopsis confluens]|uniref:Uncharacterized protein n=1 Tax=Collybiopsis confluens TaxID=2823264 RepID=A0A8H5MDF3_9AGAR|nr:hypothetical protein D9757_003590 [Collybiopsis confluens]